MICFLNFASYFRTSLLLFPNLDIRSFRDSQTMHFANIDPHFCTSTFKWCLFLNLLIANWKIPLMFNSMFISQPTNTKKQRNIKLSTIDVDPQIYIQKYISIFRKINFHEKHLVLTRHLSPNRNKKCWSFHIIHLIITFLQTLPFFKKKSHHTSCLPFPIHFIWYNIASVNKSMIEHWTPLARLMYVYLYSHVVKTNNLDCCLNCTTYMSTCKNQQFGTKQCHRCLNLE
jgi:hypothetical protein